jgi:hypothetical protein
MSVLALAASVASAQSLSPQSPIVTDLNGNPAGITMPGQEFLFKIPLTNVTTSPQTNVLGVAVPLTDGMNVVNPVSTYGSIAGSGTAEGTAYRGSLDASTSITRRYTVKLGVKSDQGQQDISVNLPGDSGFGNGSQLAAWPPANYGSGTGTIAEAASATSNELIVVSTTGLLGSTIYKNLRTGELIHVSSIEPSTKKLRVRRGQFGNVPPAACEAGDVLAFEGVPIPDGVGAGVAMIVGVNAVPGLIGNTKVNIEDIVHPRVGDLMITLQAEAEMNVESQDPFGQIIIERKKVTTSTILMNPVGNGLANGSNISNVSFADNGTTEVESQLNGLTSGVTYIPYESLETMADIEGGDVTTWTLRVSDIASPAVGYIKGGWSIEPLN